MNNAGRGRGGDFDVGDAAIHVTATPSEALIRKCCENLNSAVRPIIVTTVRGAQLADLLASQAGVRERIEVLEIGQFVATNAQELGLFAGRDVAGALDRIIERYNVVVDEYEADPSLKIAGPRTP